MGTAELRTPRLLLRRFRPEDAEEYGIIAAEWRAIMKI
jgi:hypothetical protein